MAAQDRLPQFDRAKIKTPIGFFSTLFRLMRIGEESALPAIVKAYDRSTGIATVQPIAANVADNMDNEEVIIPRNEYDVHVVRFVHGGYVIDAPLFAGDTGWIIAGDRNCASAIDANSTILTEDQTEGNAPNEGSKRPDDNSLRSFAWGFFIPDSWGTTGLTAEDGLVVNGNTISVGAKTITITADEVSVTCGGNSVTVDEDSIVAETEKCKISIEDSVILSSSGGQITASTDKDKKISIDGTQAQAVFGNYTLRLSDGAASISGKTDTVTLDDSGIHFEGPIDRKKTLVTDVRFDKNLHQLQKKTMLGGIRGDFIVALGAETGWIKAEGGQAVPEEPCRC